MTTSRTKKKSATVTFVGGGPGDPSLLTLRAAEVLAAADVLVANSDLQERLRPLCSDHVEVIDSVGDDSAEVVKTYLAAAKDGRRVVRVFGGDPTLPAA